LLQSQKTEAIGQLTGGVAHDFNNLLTAILSSLTLLRKRLRDDPQAIRLIDNATQGAQRGAALTQRMLAFARRQDLKSERIDVPSLVRGMTELLQHTLGPAWPIETRFPLSLSAVMADSNQLEMALLNLAVNARDAMPNGGTICVVAQEKTVTKNEVDRLGAGRYVSLAVVDTGSGMDAATLARATEPFFTTKGVGKGTGLGLSMVYGLAEQMGGTFLLVSEPGAGTKAELWLPLAPPVPRPERIHAPQAETIIAAERPLKILAVDDDSLVLMNTAALLEDLGHEVIEASSGDEALICFRSHPDLDLLITDQGMPTMSGLQLAAIVRQERADMPIILATGYGELPASADLKLVKLAKPFDQPLLAMALAEATRSDPSAMACRR
jgi:CheY-like chemotaxis protein